MVLLVRVWASLVVTAFSEGYVTNTSLVPAEKSTALLELLDFSTVVLAKVFEPEVDTVPNPTSNSLAF